MRRASINTNETIVIVSIRERIDGGVSVDIVAVVCEKLPLKACLEVVTTFN